MILTRAIKELAETIEGDVTFFIKDLAFPYRTSSLHDQEQIPAASLVKLSILAVAYKAVQEERISLSDIIVIEKKDITGGSGILKTMKLPASLSFRELLKIMITRSDNTAANKVIEFLGFDYINEGFKDLNLYKTILKRKMMDFSQRKKGVENFTTAAETAFLLEKLYRGKLIDEQSSDEMLSFLKEQKVNDRIPRYLPKGIVVAHKTGLEKNVVHDSGIVFCNPGGYIICVLTKDVKSYTSAKKFIAYASLMAYSLYQ